MNTPSASAPIVAVFSQSIELRVIVLDDEPWFVAGDVAVALDYDKTSNMLRILDDDEKGAHNLSTLGGTQAVTIISESGLYAAVLKSRKPEAKKFRKWVTSEVLPQIRKTGTYTLPAVKCQHDYLNGDDMKILTRLVWMIAGMIGTHARHAVWHALRVASGCVAPNRFEVRHISDLATELRRLYAIVHQYRQTQLDAEKSIITACIRGREQDDAVLAGLLDTIMAEATDPAHGYTLVATESRLGHGFDQSVMAFIQRTGDGWPGGYPGYAEGDAGGGKIKTRRDLSFTRFDDRAGVRNWVVEHDQEASWYAGTKTGAALFEEVAELAMANEGEAYDAMRFPIAQDIEFLRDGWGIECGYADAIARAAIDGLRARRAGLPAFDPKKAEKKKRGRPALPNGEKAVARLAAEVAAI